MHFMIAQIAGIFSTVFAMLGAQMKTARMVLVGQFLSNTASAVSYGLLGSLSGAWVCILAAIQSVLVSIVNEGREEKRSGRIRLISGIFSVAYIAGTIVTFGHWTDLISGICALLFVVTVAQRDAGKMRGVMLLSMSLWIILDVSVAAYTSILTHGMTILSILTAMFRLDRKKNT